MPTDLNDQRASTIEWNRRDRLTLSIVEILWPNFDCTQTATCSLNFARSWIEREPQSPPPCAACAKASQRWASATQGLGTKQTKTTDGRVKSVWIRLPVALSRRSRTCFIQKRTRFCVSFSFFLNASMSQREATSQSSVQQHGSKPTLIPTYGSGARIRRIHRISRAVTKSHTCFTDNVEYVSATFLPSLSNCGATYRRRMASVKRYSLKDSCMSCA